jgi:serine protease Do
MTLDTLLTPERETSSTDAVSAAIIELVERVRPSVVQVRRGRRGIGTGVIWRTSGGIVTNQHVVAGAGRSLEVLLPDGRSFPATVASGNAALDLALIEVAASDLPAAPVGDSTGLRVGELVFAIGNPWGQRGVVTAGIVSGLGTLSMRGGQEQAPYIRSDVLLAPGNSGGPLLNARGAVVGINAMIFGGDLAVSIPSQVASNWVAGLPSRRVTLGVGVQQVLLPAQVRQGALAERERGLLVVSLAPDGPASRAALLIGDVLLGANGSALVTTAALQQVLGALEGDRLVLQVLRAGVLQELDVALGAAQS